MLALCPLFKKNIDNVLVLSEFKRQFLLKMMCVHVLWMLLRFLFASRWSMNSLNRLYSLYRFSLTFTLCKIIFKGGDWSGILALSSMNACESLLKQRSVLKSRPNNDDMKAFWRCCFLWCFKRVSVYECSSIVVMRIQRNGFVLK